MCGDKLSKEAAEQDEKLQSIEEREGAAVHAVHTHTPDYNLCMTCTSAGMCTYIPMLFGYLLICRNYYWSTLV